MTTPDRRQVLLGAGGAAASIALSPELLAAPRRLSAPVRLALIGAGRQGRAIMGELAKFTPANPINISGTRKIWNVG